MLNYSDFPPDDFPPDDWPHDDLPHDDLPHEELIKAAGEFRRRFEPFQLLTLRPRQ